MVEKYGARKANLIMNSTMLIPVFRRETRSQPPIRTGILTSF